jgi:hypothetical protein
MAYEGPNQNTILAYAAGLPPVVALRAVSATTSPSAVLDGLSVRTVAVMQVNTSAGVSSGAVQLEGSLDKVGWYTWGALPPPVAPAPPRFSPTRPRRSAT